MKMIMIGIYDRKATEFISCTPVMNVGVALRELTEQVNTNAEAHIYKWPEDYEVHQLGDFESSSGKLTPQTNEAGDPQTKLIVQISSLKRS